MIHESSPPSAIPSSARPDESGLSLDISARSAFDQLTEVLTEIERLIGNPEVRECHVQRYLMEHPLVLHANPEEVLSQVAIGIGTKYIMDFMIKKAFGKYLLVEIENPHHEIFKRHGDFSPPVNRAVRQVEDWQEWIEDNLPSVQRNYPDISAPEGLVIIGRSLTFTREEHRKLARRNINLRGRIEIMTYDDLLSRARASIRSFGKELARISHPRADLR